MSTSTLPEELVEQILSLCDLAPPEWTVRDYFADDGLTLRARWANLTRVWLNASNMPPALLDALQRSSALQEFAAPVSSAWNWLYTRTGHPGVLVDLAKNPALETVYVVARDTWNLKHWEFEVDEAQKAIARDARPASKSSEPTDLEKILELVECVVLT